MLYNKLYYKDIISSFVCFIVVAYLFVPLIFRYYQPFSRRLIFLNMLHWPPFVNFNYPEELGLQGTYNYYLEPTNNVTIGLWHTVPNDLIGTIKNSSLLYLNTGHPIILYMHGNAGTRAGWHRIMLYRILSNLNFHIVSFDYRGFGDSSGIPTEFGVVEDALYVYNWIKEQSPDSPLILWGHSLGSGVTTRLARALYESGKTPSAVILESPFTNIEDAALSHPFSKIYRYFPWFAWCFLEPIRQNNIYFTSDKNIQYVDCPLLILHAKDDNIVPYHLGFKLYNIAKAMKKDSNIPIKFQSFEADRKFGHKHIHDAPELPDIVNNFIQKYVLGNETKNDIIEEEDA